MVDLNHDVAESVEDFKVVKFKWLPQGYGH